jgi:hypothetical protein
LHIDCATQREQLTESNHETTPPIIITGILVSILITPFASNAFANLKPQVKAPELRMPKIEYPIGENCVVTVDSFAGSRPVSSVQANANPGFVGTDIVKGVLTRVDDSWMVLKEGTYENWIPRNKVLLLRISL